MNIKSRMLNFSMSSTDPGRLSFIINVPIVNKCVLRFCILFSLIDKEKIDRRVFEKYFYSFDILSSGVNYLIGGKFSGWKFASEGFRYRILNRKIFSQKTLNRRRMLASFSWTHFETISISKLHIHAYSFFYHLQAEEYNYNIFKLLFRTKIDR